MSKYLEDHISPLKLVLLSVLVVLLVWLVMQDHRQVNDSKFVRGRRYYEAPYMMQEGYMIQGDNMQALDNFNKQYSRQEGLAGSFSDQLKEVKARHGVFEGLENNKDLEEVEDNRILTLNVKETPMNPSTSSLMSQYTIRSDTGSF